MEERTGFIKNMIENIFGKTVYNRHYPKKEKQYDVPAAIPNEYRKVFIEQAKAAGVDPSEFGAIVKREQGPLTTAENISLVGGADPNDRGLMQVNKVNEPLIQERFRKEYGREYDANKAEDSIIAASMVLQENRRIFEQMKKNQTFDGVYSNDDLINSYNLGPRGIIDARKGDEDKLKRLDRYQKAELIQ